MKTKRDKDKHAAYMRTYYAKNKVRWLANDKLRRHRNLDAFNEKRRAYRKKNPDIISAQKKRYREKDPARLKLLKHQSYLRTKQRVAATCRAWAKKNPDKIRALQRAWAARNPDAPQRYYQGNKERIKARTAAYRKAHPDCRRKHYQRHRSRLIKKASDYTKRNPHKRRQWQQKRRALKRGSQACDCSEKIALLQHERFCRWCCCCLTGHNFTIDHIIPLARGGAHAPENLCASCSSCNCSKNDKLVSEWLPTLGRYLELKEAA